MLVTDMALWDLRVRRASLLERLHDLFSRGDYGHTSAPESLTLVTERKSHLTLVPDPNPHALPDAGATEPTSLRWRRHPQLRTGAALPLLSDGERRARAIAVRGLYAAHKGDVEEAFLQFLQAVSEAAIDLTAMPSFWQMPRGAIVAAAEAYDRVGRLREASALQARVRTELRPRNVVPMRRAAAPTSPKRSSGSE
jgi:hypothetical protein